MNTVVFQVTKKCDQACPHCFFNSSPSEREELSFSQIEKALIDLQSAGIKNISKFIITGGEPTIWPYLQPTIGLIRKFYQSAKIRIDTNGINIFKNEKLFPELKADVYDISVDTFHNQGEIDKRDRYQNIYVKNNGRSPMLDFFLENKKKYKFGLYVRWTSNRQDEKLFNKFFNKYKKDDVIIEVKPVTATGRAKKLSSFTLGDGYLVKERPENFRCLMGDSLILTVSGYWHACYHPVALTKLCRVGNKNFATKLKNFTGCFLYKYLPKKGLIDTLAYLKKKNPKLSKLIDKIMAERYWYRCEPCEKLCSMRIFKRL
jgi:organic radical activating enzyme